MIATLEAESARLQRRARRGRGRGRRARARRPPSWPRPRRRWPPSASASSASGPTACAAPSGAGRRGAGRAGRAARRASSAASGELARDAGPARRLTDKSARLADEAERLRRELGAAEQAELPAGRGARRRRAAAGRRRGRRWPRPRTPTARPRPTTTPGWPGPRPWPWPSTRPAPAPAPSAWPTSTACSARCSTWSRSTPAGRPPSRPPPARRSAAVVVDGVDAARRALAALHGEAICRRGPRPRRGRVGRARRRRSASPCAATSRPTRPGVDAAARRAGRRRPSWSTAAGPTAVDVALAHPDAVVVTPDGDRFGRSGWRVGAAGSGATGAALDEARHRAEPPPTAADAGRRPARPPPGRASTRPAGPRPSSPGSSTTTTAGSRAAGDGLQRVETDRRDAATEADALQTHLDELTDRVAREQERIAELEAELPALEAAETETAERGRAHGRGPGPPRGAGRRGRRAAHRPRGPRRRRRRAPRVPAAPARRGRGAPRPAPPHERAAAEARRLELDRRQLATDRLIAPRRPSALGVIEAELGDLRERRRRQSEAAREVAAELDDAAPAAGRRRAGASTELRERLQRARDRRGRDQAAHRDRGRGPAPRPRHASPTRPWPPSAPPLPEGIDAGRPHPRARARAADHGPDQPARPRGVRGAPGAPRVPAAAARRREGVAAASWPRSSRPSTTRSSTCSPRPSPTWPLNFEQLFDTLFPGGTGRLKLTDPDNLLDTGIEVEARPSGKNVRKLSLLSGGERSLTALAFLFAVFRSRPSPFYVMDEVEAALDDVNLHRFLGLVAEFRDEAQLVIVSHQKRTMEAADCLYGVTMQPGGSSRVVSEKVGRPPRPAPDRSTGEAGRASSAGRVVVLVDQLEDVVADHVADVGRGARAAATCRRAGASRSTGSGLPAPSRGRRVAGRPRQRGG